MSKRRIEIDRRLLGTWKSDRRLTFKHHKLSRSTTLAKQRRYKATFGKLLARWGTRYLYSEMDGMKWKDEYEVIGRDSASVVVRAYNEVLDEIRVAQIFFEDDYYWFWRPWGFREYFRRVKTSSPTRNRRR